MAEREAFDRVYEKTYGKVRYAYDESGAVTHVIKRIDPEMKEIYLRLMQVRSSNLAVILAVKEENGQVLVHQEYIDGECVSEWTGDPGDAELMRMAKDVAQALKVVHGMQPPIIHRDIKPANIMRRKSGGYVLVDFDAGRVVKHDAQGDTQVMGTVGYAAPEQFGLRQTDARTDIFSLGATLYWLKTGRPVHSRSKCPGRLGHIVDKCTQLDPAKRYRSAEKLLRALDRKERRVPLQPKRMAAVAAACLLSFCAGMGNVRWAVQRTESAYADCTCRFIVTDTLPYEEQVHEFHPGDAPVELQMRVDGYMDARGCTAKKHRTAEMASLRDARLGSSTLGTEAQVARDGRMQLNGCGVYTVDAGVFFGSEMTTFVTETIVLTQQPEIYEQCCCEAVLRDSYVEIKGERALPKGGVVRLTFTPNPVVDGSSCTAQEHAEVFLNGCRIEQAPQGANYRFEDGFFYTDTAGVYRVRTEYFFGMWMCYSIDEFEITEEA